MATLGPTEWLIILLIVLLLFGAGRISQVARELGQGLRAFRESSLFPEFVCEMLVAARTGEGLEAVFARASEVLSRLEEFRARILGALIYPSVVLSFSVLAVLVVLKFVVPRLRKILLSFGRDLPLLTKALVFGAGALWWLILVGGPILALLGFWWVRRRGLAEVHRRLLAVPVAGRLWLYFDLSRWSYVAALLLQAGTVLPRAVAAAARSCENLYLREDLRSFVPALEEGESLAVHLRRRAFVPEILRELSAVGEESGTLPEMLQHASEILLREADHLIERTLRWIEPLTILVIGLIVAYIVVSVVLPIMEISSAVKL